MDDPKDPWQGEELSSVTNTTCREIGEKDRERGKMMKNGDVKKSSETTSSQGCWKSLLA